MKICPTNKDGVLFKKKETSHIKCHAWDQLCKTPLDAIASHPIKEAARPIDQGRGKILTIYVS
jgi:hypothetical protein